MQTVVEITVDILSMLMIKNSKVRLLLQNELRPFLTVEHGKIGALSGLIGQGGGTHISTTSEAKHFVLLEEKGQGIKQHRRRMRKISESSIVFLNNENS